METAVLVAEQKADIATSVRVCALRKEAVGSAGWMAQHAGKRRLVSGLFYAISAFNQESVYVNPSYYTLYTLYLYSLYSHIYTLCTPVIHMYIHPIYTI